MSKVFEAPEENQNSNIYERVQNLRFPIGEFIVVGGVLEVHGIRKANDIDIIATDSLLDSLIQAGWQQFPLNSWDQGVLTQKRKVNKGNVDVMNEFSWRKTLIKPTPELIKTAEYYEGLPFVPLQLLLQWKEISEREKDRTDAELIRKFLIT